MMSSATARIAVAIVAVLVCAIVMTGFFTLQRFQAVFTEGVEDRLRFAAEDIRTSLEAGLALGVPLPALGRAETMLGRAVAQDPGILSVDVFDADGEVVFATDRGVQGDLVPERWLDPWRAARLGVWRTLDGDALVVGTGLAGPSGAPGGGIAIRYAREALDRPLARVRDGLFRLGLAIAAVTAVLAGLGVRWLLGDLRRSLRRMEQAARVAVRAPDGRVAFSPAPYSPLEDRFAAFLTTVGRAARAGGAAGEQVRRLDEAG